jgi:two-component system, OmpR family, sensor kinase
LGRLFWKFFLFLMLAQVTTVVAVSTAIWLRQRAAAAQYVAATKQTDATLLDQAAATLERDGEPALQNLLKQWAREPLPAVYAIDATGRDVLGRRVPPGAGPESAVDGMPAETKGARRTALADGRWYTLFIGEHPPGPPPPVFSLGPFGGPGGPGGPGGRSRNLYPVDPIVGGILASLVVAALLAWYIAKPIGSLRRAFDAAAQGDLDVRIGDRMGRRRDELADLGRDFDRTAAKLKLLMDMQRRLLHDVSHELRSPLARLQAAVGLARQQPGNVEASMERIEREAVRMDKLVDELLTLSRTEAGMGAQQTDVVDLAEIVDEVVQDASFEVGAGAAPVRFATDIGALASAQVKGSPEMLHRAIENVVRNAARYTPPGGCIEVAARQDAARREVSLTIADQGPGVAPAELEAIFQPFFRGGDVTISRGHGLGLAIARRVIEAHGGRISASNRPTGGLCVTIVLPA